MIHEDIQLTGSFQASGSFNAPLHAGTGSALQETGSIFNDTTDNFLKIYDGNNWLIVGLNTASLPIPVADIEYLVVAGGAGGGGWGGGGGAGGLLSSSLSSVESGSSFTVTIGAGATATGRSGGNYVAGGDGTDSSVAGTTISTITSTGGGGGGYFNNNVGRDGGSGGGGGIRSSNGTVAGGSGTTGQGKDGGLGAGNSTNSPYSGGGGGGGAGAVGSDGQSSGYYYGGNGGDGKQSNITGTPTYYAGGGGGHTDGRTVNAPSVSSGGQGGGGNGGRYGGSSGATNAQDGTANTGGGGGAAYGDSPYGLAGGGGSGVVILAYDSGSVNGAGGIVGDAGNDRKYNQFNTTGTFKVGSTSDFSIVTNSLEVHLDAGNFASRGTSTWTDLSGNGRNFTANNGPVLGNNFYYDLDGSNDYFGDVSYQVNDYMTIMTWIKPDSLVSSDGVIDINTSGNSGGFALGSRSDNNIGFTWRDDAWSSGGYPYLADDTNLVDSNWHCIAGVYNGNAYLYVDDMSTAAQSNTSRNSTLTQVSGQYIRIGLLGNQSSTYALDGGIGMVMIYSKALTTTELLQNYNATKHNFI